jgi:hypothetical protein
VAAGAGRQRKAGARPGGRAAAASDAPGAATRLGTVFKPGPATPPDLTFERHPPLSGGLFTFLYADGVADGTVAGLYRLAVTVLEVVEDLGGVLRRALLEVEVVPQILLVAVLGTQKRDDRNMFAIVACCKLPPGVINRSRVVNEPVAALDSRVDDAEFPDQRSRACASSRFLTAFSRSPAVGPQPAEGPRMRRIAARTAIPVLRRPGLPG